MAKKCFYCKEEIDENSVVDFCEKCGISVWGEKMFKAIIKNMEKAREEGNLWGNIDFSLENTRKLI